MKKRVCKVIAAVLAMVLVIGTLAACGGNSGGTAGSQAADGGKKTGGNPTIMFLSSQTAGVEYNMHVNYLEDFLGKLGYDLIVVYGDQFNDPDGNLTAVKNGMVGNVVGLITEQDGGLTAIMEEYPELYVAGLNTDMTNVFGAEGSETAVLTNDHFLGTTANGKATGEEIAQTYIDEIKAKGYKKISLMIFPEFAFPNYAAAANLIKTKLGPENGIEVVGDPEVLMFSLLDDSYFMEADHQKLDAVVALCDGISFVYPTMISAIANGNCAATTKLMTGGLTDDATIMADCGDEGTISYNYYACPESALFAIAMLDNAINGKQYADFTAPQCLSSACYEVGDTATFQAIQTKSALYTGNMNDVAVPWEEAQQYFTRYNEGATYADLTGLLNSDTLKASYFLTK